MAGDNFAISKQVWVIDLKALVSEDTLRSMTHPRSNLEPEMHGNSMLGSSTFKEFQKRGGRLVFMHDLDKTDQNYAAAQKALSEALIQMGFQTSANDNVGTMDIVRKPEGLSNGFLEELGCDQDDVMTITDDIDFAKQAVKTGIYTKLITDFNTGQEIRAGEPDLESNRNFCMTTNTTFMFLFIQNSWASQDRSRAQPLQSALG